MPEIEKLSEAEEAEIEACSDIFGRVGVYGRVIRDAEAEECARIAERAAQDLRAYGFGHSASDVDALAEAIRQRISDRAKG